MFKLEWIYVQTALDKYLGKIGSDKYLNWIDYDLIHHVLQLRLSWILPNLSENLKRLFQYDLISGNGYSS